MGNAFERIHFYTHGSILIRKISLGKSEDNVLINASYLPTEILVDLVKNLKTNEAIYDENELIAYRSDRTDLTNFDDFKVENCPKEAVFVIKHTWDLFSENGRSLAEDFKLLTHGRRSQPIPDSVHCINKEQIFLEEGAVIETGYSMLQPGPFTWLRTVK